MKRWLSLMLAASLLTVALCGCCCISSSPEEDTTTTEEATTITTTTNEKMDVVTAQDTADAVNRAGKAFENSFHVEKYTETVSSDSSDTDKLFSFSYLNGLYTVLGTADESGEVLNMHTTAFYANFSEDVEASTYMLLSVIPAIACHETLADADIEEAMTEMVNLFSDNLSGKKSTFTSNGYEFTLQMSDSFLLVSAIKQE